MLLAILAAIWVSYSYRTREDIALAITVIGGVFSFFFVIQKQAGEDIHLFKELFVEFNKRYDTLNEKLNRIAAKKPTSPLTKEERDTLSDYFNLCGEEYLYFKQGFILPEVWQSWCNGMYFFIENPRIKLLWSEEEKSLSYYGLTSKIIYNGTGRRKGRNP
jgi:hypothetical protein